MSTEFNELLSGGAAFESDPPPSDYPPMGDRLQIWLIGSREQVQHGINEFYVRRMVLDRTLFSPIVPCRLFPGKFMSTLER